METLYIKTEKGEVKEYLLNTEINQKTLDASVNKIIDANKNCEWWIKDGWELKNLR